MANPSTLKIGTETVQMDGRGVASLETALKKLVGPLKKIPSPFADFNGQVYFPKGKRDEALAEIYAEINKIPAEEFEKGRLNDQSEDEKAVYGAYLARLETALAAAIAKETDDYLGLRKCAVWASSLALGKKDFAQAASIYQAVFSYLQSKLVYTELNVLIGQNYKNAVNSGTNIIERAVELMTMQMLDVLGDKFSMAATRFARTLVSSELIPNNATTFQILVSSYLNSASISEESREFYRELDKPETLTNVGDFILGTRQIVSKWIGQAEKLVSRIEKDADAINKVSQGPLDATARTVPGGMVAFMKPEDRMNLGAENIEDEVCVILRDRKSGGVELMHIDNSLSDEDLDYRVQLFKKRSKISSADDYEVTLIGARESYNKSKNPNYAAIYLQKALDLCSRHDLRIVAAQLFHPSQPSAFTVEVTGPKKDLVIKNTVPQIKPEQYDAHLYLRYMGSATHQATQVAFERRGAYNALAMSPEAAKDWVDYGAPISHLNNALLLLEGGMDGLSAARIMSSKLKFTESFHAKIRDLIDTVLVGLVHRDLIRIDDDMSRNLWQQINSAPIPLSLDKEAKNTDLKRLAVNAAKRNPATGKYDFDREAFAEAVGKELPNILPNRIDSQKAGAQQKRG